MANLKREYWKRRSARHVVLALVSASITAAFFYGLELKDAIIGWSMASAYSGLVFLGASLVMGPWNVLRGRPNPAHTDLRRDIGIWAALLGLAHTAVGLQAHLRGKMWQYFFYPSDQVHRVPLRLDAFGVANLTGLGSALVLLLLLGLSNNRSLRALGTERWKTLQRWNYAAFALMAVHGVLYQIIVKRTALFVTLFAAGLFAVAAMQFAGFRTGRIQNNRTGETRQGNGGLDALSSARHQPQ